MKFRIIPMNYLSAENLSKTFGDKTLFEKLNLGLDKGEKTALIASNGSGKSTLLSILAGRLTPDTGQVTLREGIQAAYLEQDPHFPVGQTIDELIAAAHTSISSILKAYQQAIHEDSLYHNADTRRILDETGAEMDRQNAWDYERRLKQLLSLFRITDTTKRTDLLSGGEKKRLALALVLLDEPDLLILDEPTNHLDIDMIEWLEAYLSRSKLTLLMVTHDRYFLDRVCDHILEMNNGRLYYHEGNYEYFLQKKSEREEVTQTETDKARQLMKKELEWLRRQPKARTTKSKSRIQSFDAIREKATGAQVSQEISLQVNMQRLGGKILEIEHLSKRYDDTQIVDDFSYLFKKGERIGIVGRNGSGKTSFLNLITRLEKPDSGKIETGQTIVFGYYQQAGFPLDEDRRVIDIARDVAEVVRGVDGQTMTISRFLDHFMFPPEVQYKQAGSLSGGEKRRLNLLLVLIKSPNFLILDEPTNDLDLPTLNKLEEFLMNYNGCLILVSHDRYFLDRLTDHLFIFEGNGKVRDYYGAYSAYVEEKERDKQAGENQKKQVQKEVRGKSIASKPKTRLTFREQREYETLESEIGQLEREKAEIETILHSGITDYEKLNALSQRIGEVIDLIDTKMMRWMELDEFAE